MSTVKKSRRKKQNKPNEYDDLLSNEIQHYYLYVKNEDNFVKKLNQYHEVRKQRCNKILNFWCFNPGLGFKKIL